MWGLTIQDARRARRHRARSGGKKTAPRPSVWERKVVPWIKWVAIAYLISAGLRLVLDEHTGSVEPEEDWQDLLYALVPLAFFVVVGIWAVLLLGRGDWRRSVLYGAISVVVVVLTAGGLFAVVEADHCACPVPFRRGGAEAVWIAFDTVPILKLNETLGWVEPQPLSAVTTIDPEPSASAVSTSTDLASQAPGAPVGRWAPALLVRFAVGFVLLALAKGLFDLFRHPA